MSDSPLTRRLSAYAVSASAALAGVSSASAAIVLQPESDPDILVNAATPSVDFSFGLPEVDAFQFNFAATSYSDQPFKNLDIFQKSPQAQWVGGSSVGSFGSGTILGAFRLELGQPVSAGASPWNGWPKASVTAPATGVGLLYGNLAFYGLSPAEQQGQFLGQTGFLGVRFQFEGNLHYGWIEASGNPTATVLTISNWAFNDVPNEGLLAGTATPVPESAHLPAGLALLALGATGILHYRRQRR